MSRCATGEMMKGTEWRTSQISQQGVLDMCEVTSLQTMARRITCLASMAIVTGGKRCGEIHDALNAI